MNPRPNFWHKGRWNYLTLEAFSRPLQQGWKTVFDPIDRDSFHVENFFFYANEPPDEPPDEFGIEQTFTPVDAAAA